MKVKSKNSVLITIIVLLVIFVPLSIIGTVAHFTDSGLSSGKQLYRKGYLYFYQDGSNTLLGKYKCFDKICDYAYEFVNDDTIGLNYYNDNSVDKIELVNNKYAFIVDSKVAPNYYRGVPISLYDVVNDQSKINLNAVKNYTIGIDNDYFIVQNALGKWGVIQLRDEVKSIIPYTYMFIGLKNNITDSNKIKSDRFVVKDDKGFKIINDKEEALSTYFEGNIIDYNDEYIANKKDDAVYITNYQGSQSIMNSFKNVRFFDKYVGVIDLTGNFSIINPVNGNDLSKKYTIDSFDSVKYSIVDNGIELDINGEKELVTATIDDTIVIPQYDFSFNN